MRDRTELVPVVIGAAAGVGCLVWSYLEEWDMSKAIPGLILLAVSYWLFREIRAHPDYPWGKHYPDKDKE